MHKVIASLLVASVAVVACASFTVSPMLTTVDRTQPYMPPKEFTVYVTTVEDLDTLRGLCGLPNVYGCTLFGDKNTFIVYTNGSQAVTIHEMEHTVFGKKHTREY